MKNFWKLLNSDDPIVNILFWGLVALTLCTFVTAWGFPGHIIAALAGNYWHWLWAAVNIIAVYFWGSALGRMWKLAVATEKVAEDDAANVS